jgi:hypothetical protein
MSNAELSESVAKAAGLSAYTTWCEPLERAVCIVDGVRIFDPWTNLADAFEAATRAGVFRLFHRFLSDDEFSGFVVYEADGKTVSSYASGVTPAIALCEATLKAAEERKTHLNPNPTPP